MMNNTDPHHYCILITHLLHMGHFGAAKRLTQCYQHEIGNCVRESTRAISTAPFTRNYKPVLGKLRRLNNSLPESGKECQSICAIADALIACNSKPALTWHKQRRGKLRRFNSSLPFNIMLRETAVKSSCQGIVAAVEFAREHLSGPCVAEFNDTTGGSMLRLRAAQRVLGGIAVGAATDPGARAWARLALQFEKEGRKLQNYFGESVLEVCLRVGLSALKTTACHARPNARAGYGSDRRCPVCAYPPLTALAFQMPVSCVNQSFLRCRVCCVADIATLFLPCHHTCVCPDCAAYIKNCPVCQVDVRSMSRIYLL